MPLLPICIDPVAHAARSSTASFLLAFTCGYQCRGVGIRPWRGVDQRATVTRCRLLKKQTCLFGPENYIEPGTTSTVGIRSHAIANLCLGLSEFLKVDWEWEPGLKSLPEVFPRNNWTDLFLLLLLLGLSQKEEMMFPGTETIARCVTSRYFGKNIWREFLCWTPYVQKYFMEYAG